MQNLIKVKTKHISDGMVFQLVLEVKMELDTWNLIIISWHISSSWGNFASTTCLGIIIYSLTLYNNSKFAKPRLNAFWAMRDCILTCFYNQNKISILENNVKVINPR